MSNLIKSAALFIGGAAVGAAVAMLLTPKTGEEIRNEIADLAQDVKKNAQDYCEQLKKDLADAAVAAAAAAPQEAPAQPKSKRSPKKRKEA